MRKHTKWKRAALMTLSHAIKQKPNLSENAINYLRAILKTKIERAQKNISFEETEKEIHTAFIEVVKQS